MDLELKEARVVVAGSSKGTGFHIARAFHREGAIPWISGRGETTVRQASAELVGAPFTVCDLQAAQGRESLVKSVESAWGRVDCLVINVGSGKSSARGVESPDSEWERMLQLNLLTPVALIREFLPLLKESKAPSIVALSSIAGQMRLSAPLSYSAAKAALDHFCACSVDELSSHGIRFNLVAPGNILTTGGTWDERLKQSPDSVNQYIHSKVPMKRFASGDEVASAVLFLSSRKANFCTGSVLRVDGGQAGVV